MGMTKLAQYFKWRKVPASLRSKAKHYRNYVFESYENVLGTEAEMLDIISPTLKQQACMYIHGRAIRSVTSLKWLTNHNLACQQLLMRAKAEVIAPGDVVFLAGEVADRLYCVTDGFINLTNLDKDLVAEHDSLLVHLDPCAFYRDEIVVWGREGKLLGKETCFGCSLLLSLLDSSGPVPYDQRRLYTAASDVDKHSKLTSLSLDAIREVMRSHPFLQEEFEDWAAVKRGTHQVAEVRTFSENAMLRTQRTSTFSGLQESGPRQAESNQIAMHPSTLRSMLAQENRKDDPKAEMKAIQRMLDDLIEDYRALQREDEAISSRLARREINRHPAHFRGVGGYIRTSASIVTHQIQQKARIF